MIAAVAERIVPAAVAVLLLAGLAVPALAAGAPSGGGAPQDTKQDTGPGAAADADLRRAVALIRQGDFAAAVALLRAAEARTPDDPDIHNWLGYALRRLQRYEPALKHYRIALSLAPLHRGANEYLGELHLALGRLAEAEARLAVLKRACPAGCEEYDELAAAIAAYRKGKGTGRKGTGESGTGKSGTGRPR